jgi:hypothetical protein
MDQVEFEFPDEKEEKAAASKNETRERVEDVSFEIEDDTPEEDRGRTPTAKEVVQTLEVDVSELDQYSEDAKKKMIQMKKIWNDERRRADSAERSRW